MRLLGFCLGAALLGCSGTPNDSTHGSANDGTATGGTASAGTSSGGSGASMSGVGGSGTAGTTTSGGTTSTAGTSAGGTGSNAGGTSTGGTNNPDPPPKNILPCDEIGEIGVWENVTPPDIMPLEGDDMTNRFGVDPVNSGTVYLGTNHLGIWKTTDCGATWFRPAGPDGPKCGWDNKTCAETLETGLQWSFAIDPIEPEILYANSGYGAYGSGMLKSTNGGVDWDEIWPKNAGIDGVNGFVGSLRIDPLDHLHVILTFHEAPNIAESKDGGATWKLIEWGGSEAWIIGGDHWLSPNNGLWLTTNAGGDWTKVSEANSSGHSTGFMYQSSSGAYYLGAQEGIVRSEDGLTWSVVPNSGHLVKPITGDGTTMFASSYSVPWFVDEPVQPYISSSEADGLTWDLMPSPEMNPGADDMHYDLDHHILYSSNCQGGFWRVRTQ